MGINLPDDKLFEKSIDVQKIKLKKDDMLLIYTDGVTEAMNEERDQFGEERLLQLMKDNGRKSPQEFIDDLSREIDEFTGEYPQNDDITVVAFKEKYMADEVLSGIRKKLLELVSVGGMSVAEACTKMKVSPSTYYRYKKRLELLGERGLKNKHLRGEHEIKRLSNEQRVKLLEVIKENPRFGPKRIVDRLNVGRDKDNPITPLLVYEELKRMRLNTYEKRWEYLKRNALIPEDEVKEGTKEITEESKIAIEEGKSEKLDRDAASEYDLKKSFEDGITETGGDRIGKEWIYEEEVEELSYGRAPVVSTKCNKDITILKVSGHLDSSSTGELESVMEDLYEDGTRNIIVDLEDVSYISSGGWGVLVSRVKYLREKEGDVVLVGMSSEVYDIFELFGFMDIIMQFRLKDEAFEFLSLPFRERQKQLKAKQKSRRKKKTEKKLISETPGEEISDMVPLRIKAGSVGKSGEINVLELYGIIDTVSSVELRKVFERILKKGTSKIVVDMSGIEYVSSSGWGVIVSKIEGLRKKGGDIKIFGMGSEVNRIFQLLELDNLMHSFNVLAEAVEDFDVEITAPGYDKNDLESESAVVVTEKKKQLEVDESSFRANFERIKTPENEGVVLEVSGAVDASTNDEFEINLEKSLIDNPAFLIIDLSNVVYINSSGWGNIAKCAQELNSSGIKLALAGMNQAIYKIFTDLGFESLISHFLDRKTAIDSIMDSSGINTIPSDDKETINKEEKLLKEVKQNRVKDADRVGESLGERDEKTESGILYSPGIKEEEYINLSTAKEGNDNDCSRELLGNHKTSFGSDLDIEKKKVDKREEKDRKIKNVGWSAYGTKLFKRNKKKD